MTGPPPAEKIPGPGGRRVGEWPLFCILADNRGTMVAEDQRMEPMKIEPVLRRGFPGELRRGAAELYDGAFGEKLAAAIRDKERRLAVLERGIVPDFCFAAMQGTQLAGIAGFRTPGGSFTGGITLPLLFTTLGILRAPRAVLMLSLLDRKSVRGQLLLDGIAVASSMRGRGIGTKLLDRLKTHARDEGYRSIRLDVVDTNPAARRLYERNGFRPVRSARFPGLQWLLGFGSVTEMRYSVDGS